VIRVGRQTVIPALMQVRTFAPASAVPPSTLLNNLVAFWPLTEASGDRTDVSVNGLTLTAGGVVPPSRDTGKVYDYAADFDGTANDDVLTSSAAALLALAKTSFSIAAWVKLYSLPSAPAYRYIASGANNSWTHGFNFFVSGASIVLQILNGHGGDKVTHADGVALNTWALCQGYWNSGIEVASRADNGSWDVQAYTSVLDANAGGFTVGARVDLYAGKSWDGLIGPLMVWSRVLTTDEWTALYNAGAGVQYPF
jgi:Concanavalin A-like lectin/glucanases superfamily